MLDAFAVRERLASLHVNVDGPPHRAGHQHQVSVVAQLLVLLDGIEARGQVFVLATTNRPEHVDPTLRRAGRFDQVVWIGLPDELRPADLLECCIRELKLDARLTPDH
jgi:ATP-dependent Zn protease